MLQTRPLYFAHNTVRVNADFGHGSLRAEIVDVMGRPLKGYTLENSDPFGGDSLEHVMTWGGQAELDGRIIGDSGQYGKHGRLLAIRFHIDSGKLYSFAF